MIDQCVQKDSFFPDGCNLRWSPTDTSLEDQVTPHSAVYNTSTEFLSCWIVGATPSD